MTQAFCVIHILARRRPSDVSAIAARHGLVWGGDWHGKKDFMHFEWSGRDVAETGGSTGSVAGVGGSTGTPVASDTDKAIAEAERRLADMEQSPSLGKEDR
jgi:D-alanyl-D-alanine carboxypeptidase